MNRQWTTEEIKKWYDELPWLRGCNFLPSDCINRLDMWQSIGREQHLKTADAELKMCDELGFNTVRLWLNFDVYYKEPEEFMSTLENYISLCDKHRQKVMLVLAYEEDLPDGDVFVAKELGEQKVYHNHFNRDYTHEAECKKADSFRHYMEYPELKPLFLEMIERVVKRYRTDERVFAWNVENEPGIAIGERAIPLLEELFAFVRSLDPVQPLAADVWSGVNDDGEIGRAAERKACELSDFVSFHSYAKYESFVAAMYALKNHFDRPVIVTEWLNRCNHNDIGDLYPLFMLNRIGCYCWGFVGGGTCTTEPWDSIWTSENLASFDVTKWQHDLYRLNYRPYDPKEIDLIKRCNDRVNKIELKK